MQINCVIVDDEYLAVRVLEEYALNIPELNVLKAFTDPQLAMFFLQSNTVDLILLDIQMPYLDGFELIKKIPQPPLIIFTTARHDFAVQAYELDVLDYLVKPFAFERFQKAIERAKEYLQYKQKTLGVETELRNYLMIKADYRILKIQFEELVFIEGLNEYVKIHTDSKTYTTLAALKELEKDLPSNQFIRIHKSYIIALSAIADFNTQSVRMKSGREFPIGRSYKDQFLKQVKR